MTDPTLDGPDAERRLATVLAATYGPAPTSEQVDAAIHALNEADVVLCDHDALTELRQQAKAGEARVSTIEQVPCTECRGSGVEVEHHDYATEYLGCGDCGGTGRLDVSMLVAALVAQMRVADPPDLRVLANIAEALAPLAAETARPEDPR